MRRRGVSCSVVAATCVVFMLGVPRVVAAPPPLPPLKVTVYPARATVGEPLVVSATGFAPGAAVDVFLDRSDVATATATDGGEARARIVGDDVTERGRRWITVRERSSGRAVQTAMTVGPLLDPRWVAAIRDVREGESIFWTDVAGEFAYPVGVAGSTAVVAWHGSVIGEEAPEERRSRLVGLDLASGDVRWAHEGHLATGWTAISDEHLVVATSGDRLLVGLDAGTGTIEWRRWFSPGGFVDPLAVGDVVVGLTDDRSALVAVDPSNGTSVWGADLAVRSSDSGSREIVSDGETLWVSVEPEPGTRGLRRLDPDTGEIMASIVPPPRARSLLAATPDEIYVAGWSEGRWSSDLALAALEPEDGDVRWVRAVMPKDCHSTTESCIPRGMEVVPAGDLVVVRTFVERMREEPCALGCPFGRDLWALDAETGRVAWHVTLEDDWEGGPGLEVAGGVLYATDDSLVARSLDDGSVLARASAPDRPEGQEVGSQRYSSGAISSAEGTVVIGTWSGTIEAIEAIEVTAPPDPATVSASDLSPASQPTPAADTTPTPVAEPTSWAQGVGPLVIRVVGGLLIVFGLVLLLRRRHPPRHVEPSPR